MPLYAMRFENGQPVKGQPLYEFLELHGEMPGEDFMGPDLKNVYEPNFTSPPHDSLDENLSKLKRDLAETLNGNMQGPYFVHDKNVNGKTTLRVTIINPYDKEWFSDRWGHEFKIDAASADKNIMSHFNRVCAWQDAKDLRLTQMFDDLRHALQVLPAMPAEKLPNYLRQRMPGAFA